MEIQEYFDEKKKLQNLLLAYIEDESQNEAFYDELNNYINKQKILDHPDEIMEFLHLLSSISLNHYRNPTFFDKIEQILNNYSTAIKQSLSNFTIFNIFKRSKRILLYLLESNIITIEKSIFNYLYDKYRFYFFNEIKPFLSETQCQTIEQELKEKDPEIFTNFDAKRKIGQNDSFICNLIRNDSAQEFISYINRTNYPLTSKIKHSIFETNQFLIKKETDLIEYACFFGSINIFLYLIRDKKVEISPKLLPFAIHSNNGELIQIIKDKGIEIDMDCCKECLAESVICHHNEIGNYFKEFAEKKFVKYWDRFLVFEASFLVGFHYHNYEFLPFNCMAKTSYFYCLFIYDYLSVVKIYLKNKELKLDQPLILIVFIFYKILIAFLMEFNILMFLNEVYIRLYVFIKFQILFF